MGRIAITGSDVFDGVSLHKNSALVLEDGRIDAICGMDRLPVDAEVQTTDGGTVMPGFVDLQVNGGGGVMFNDDPSVEALATIAAAHRGIGTLALLPTLITDTREHTTAAIRAAVEATRQGVEGIIGLHLEGPHLSVARKGAHDPALIRPMETADLEQLIAAAEKLPNLMVTVAPESVTPAQVRALADAGVIVALGHTDASYDDCREAFEAGARLTTHLFNAMSQLGSREPGLVGATLDCGRHAGLIADGVHVHPATMRSALAAKTGPGRIFLVTDAMSTAGSDIAWFELNGRRIARKDGRLTLPDGTLAGADLTMAGALTVMTEDVGVDPAHAFAMATSYPADVLRDAGGHGVFRAGGTSNAIHLSRDMTSMRVL